MVAMRQLGLLAGSAALLVLLGCGDSGRQGAAQHDERFVGQWLVHEVEPHALYSASLFLFGGTGGLRQTWDAGFYPQATHGYVRSPDSSVICAFGSSWESRAAATVILAGVCTDGRARDIRLAFPADTQLDRTDVTPEIVSVGGETDWLPPLWGWAFRKCDSQMSKPAECGALFPG